jgi:hypothetical protein
MAAFQFPCKHTPTPPRGRCLRPLLPRCHLRLVREPRSGGSEVEFIDENGGGPGVRLRKRIHKKLGKQSA